MKVYQLSVLFQNLAREFIISAESIELAIRNTKDFCLWFSNEPLPSFRILDITPINHPVFGGTRGGIILKEYDDEEILEVEDWQVEEQQIDWNTIQKELSFDEEFFSKEKVNLTNHDGTITSFEIMRYKSEFMDKFIDSLNL